jgi:hypothetical protein
MQHSSRPSLAAAHCTPGWGRMLLTHAPSCLTRCASLRGVTDVLLRFAKHSIAPPYEVCSVAHVSCNVRMEVLRSCVRG